MEKALIVLFLIFIPFSGFGSGRSEQSIELKMGHFANEDHVGNKAAIMFAEAVEKRTDGAIRVSIFPNNQLGSPPEVLRQNIEGSIDMSLPSQGQLALYSPKFGCLMLPFLFESYDQVSAVLDGPFIEWVGPDIEDQGLVFLSNWEWGFRNLTNSVKPIYSPEDMKGLIIRTPPELANQLTMEALGASSKTIAWTELPMALKQRVVDGQENPISVIHSYKIYETQKYMTITNHTYNAMVHVISKKTWETLSGEHQRVIREESIRAGNYMRKTVRGEEDKQLRELEELGMEIIWPDIEEFKSQMGPAYKKMEEILGKENITSFLQMVDKTVYSD